METREFKVQGMHCGGCEGTLKRALGLVPGVASSAADHQSGMVSVVFDPARASEAEIRRAIEGAGYDLAG
ncbi:MAG: heavy-metal-associated domain-containing protein [Acidobacteria bacterium]|nr:heavy-metal-associated domain-containing protein [Acidobacteriota bacterium]